MRNFFGGFHRVSYLFNVPMGGPTSLFSQLLDTNQTLDHRIMREKPLDQHSDVGIVDIAFDA